MGLCVEMCDKSFDVSVKSALSKLKNCEIKELSGPQKSALRSFVSGKDTFTCLPTGHGKPLIYQLSVRVVAELTSLAEPVELVVSLLNSLISDQIKECERLGLKAWICQQESSLIAELSIRCECDIIFSSPEVMESLTAKRLLQRQEKRLIGIVVDESHCVMNWLTVFLLLIF